MTYITGIIGFMTSFMGAPTTILYVKRLTLVLSILVGCEVAHGAFTLYAPFDYSTFHASLDGGAREAVAQAVVHLCGNSTTVFGVEHLREVLHNAHTMRCVYTGEDRSVLRPPSAEFI